MGRPRDGGLERFKVNVTLSNYLLGLVINCDDEGIETARVEVGSEDLGILATAYWELETWDQKGLLIHLVQDHIDPRTRDILYDFLRAPDDVRGDFVEVTKAIALSLLEEDRERLLVYYKDRELLARMVERTLAERPTEHAKSNDTGQAKKHLESALQPKPVRGIANAQVQAGGVQFNSQRELRLLEFADTRILSNSNLPYWNHGYDITIWIRMVLDAGGLDPFTVEVSVNSENADGVTKKVEIEPAWLLSQ